MQTEVLPRLESRGAPVSGARTDSAAMTGVLIVSAAAADHAVLESIFKGSHWTLRHAQLVQEASSLLARHVVPVVICAQSLPDGSWKDLLATFESVHQSPSLLVTSGALDDSLWADVLNFGGCDVLLQPFDHREVVWSAGLAWRQWNSRRGADHGLARR
jgi:DNA-binding NtrC family response regulator